MFLNCDSNLTNSECRFILLTEGITLTPGWIDALMWSMIILEVVVLIIGLVVATLTIWVVAQRSTIHPNFSRIVIVFTLHNYVLAGSRPVLLLFQTGILKATEPSNSVLLLITSSAHIHEIAASVIVFVGLIAERVFATVYIADYEMLKRSEVSVFIIGICVPSCSITAFVLTTGFVNNLPDTLTLIGAGGSALVVTAVIISIVIYRKNKIHVELAQSTIKYSLSTKFQLAENFRVFQTLMCVLIVYSIGSAIGSPAFQLHVYYHDKDTNISSLFGELFDLSHSIANPCCIGMFVLSTRQWRQEIQLLLSRFIPCLPAPQAVNVEGREMVSDSYFNVLSVSWNNQPTANNRQCVRFVS